MKRISPRVAFTVLVASMAFPSHSPAQKSPDMKIIQNDYGVPGSEERFNLEAAIVRQKLDTALLPAMRAHGIDIPSGYGDEEEETKHTRSRGRAAIHET